jgi:hypothetical protein
MSCCGQKRAAWQAQAQERRETLSVVTTSIPQPPPRQRSRIFEYVGGGTLTLRGAMSGTAYRFTSPGARVEVSYEDSFAMMAERHVRVLQ